MSRSLVMPVLCSVTLAVTRFVIAANRDSKDPKEMNTVPPATPLTPVSPVPPTPQVPAVLNFTMNSLDGKPVDLSKYQGKVVLIVNTASKCGYTPQYKTLQALHEKYADKDLIVLGFPSNDFGKQEPGTDEEIGAFCEKNYGVKFDMFAKITVKGAEMCPLYQCLTSKETNPQFAGEVKWNFEKFLIDREGKVINRFGSKIAPDSEEMVKAIEAELGKPASKKGV